MSVYTKHDKPYTREVGGLPYKSNGGDRRNFGKEVTLKGTKILFCGCGSNSFSKQDKTSTYHIISGLQK